RGARAQGLGLRLLDLLALADVGREGDDLGAVGGLQPVEDDRGVEPARVGEHHLAYLLAALLHPSDHPSTWVGIYAPPVNKDARLSPAAAAGKRPGRPSERGERGGDEHQRAADHAQGAEPLAE